MIKNQSDKIFWTDVHTHLNMLDIPVETALESARSAGVQQVISIGTEPSDWDKVQGFCRHFPHQVQGALGVHPHSACLYNDEVEKVLEKGLDSLGIVALGEIGLDYYYEHSKRLEQKAAFYRQLSLAKAKNLPVEIHTRSAEEDTLEILSEFKGEVRGLLHCFSGSWPLAREALDIGFDISFSGIVTFKKAEDLREVCRKIPLDRLHLETDAPYLAPQPHRGKKNQPALLPHTAQVVAELHKVSLFQLSQRTEANYKCLFVPSKTTGDREKEGAGPRMEKQT